MSFSDRLFWFFAILFFACGTFLAVWLNEAGIAAVVGYLLGSTIDKLERVRSNQT